MKQGIRIALLLLLVCGVSMMAGSTATERLMVESGKMFVQSLDRLQKGRTLFDFDTKSRTEWHFFPSLIDEYGYRRNGITFKDMSPKQKHLANALLSSGLSRAGYVKVVQVMALEDIIRIIEDDSSGYRDTENYHFSIFGSPSMTGNWGWRVEGHHLSLHYAIKNGRLVSSSPTFLGANPHEVVQGVHKGLRALDLEEDLALALMNSLDEAQKRKAIFDDVAPFDILTMADRRARLEGSPEGLPASEMSSQQYEMLMHLIAEYAHNMPPDVAAARMSVAQQTPRDQLYFAWAGQLSRPKPEPVPIGGRTTGKREPRGNYYRVQAPTFLIEYDNTQNLSNHTHSVWREFQNDYGLDVLALHHQQFDHRQLNAHTSPRLRSAFPIPIPRQRSDSGGPRFPSYIPKHPAPRPSWPLVGPS